MNILTGLDWMMIGFMNYTIMDGVMIYENQLLFHVILCNVFLEMDNGNVFQYSILNQVEDRHNIPI